MSSVLRKKIESGRGVPPSVLRAQGFWSELQTGIEDWAHASFGVEVRSEIESRRVMRGNAALNRFDEDIAFVFGADVAPGLCAILMDNSAGVRYASRRLREDGNGLAEASALFLRLVCEEAAVGLWNGLASGLVGHHAGFVRTAASDAKKAAGKFDETVRYLEVSFRIFLKEESIFEGETTVEREDVQIWLIFDLEYLQQFARDYIHRAAARKAESCHHSPETLRKSVQTSMISVGAVLDRLDLTIGDCSRLEVGHVLPLASAETGRLTLAAETINGSLDIGMGEMGVWKQNRAFKLSAPIAESFVRDVADL